MADLTLPGSYASTGVFTQTYTGIDPAALKPGELARALYRGSRWVDRICRQTLYAQLDTIEVHEDRSPQGFSVDLTDGLLKVFPKKFPIRSVVSLTQQYSSADTPAAIPTSQIHIDPDSRSIWVEANLWPTFRHSMPPMYLLLSYVNGFAVTTLASQANAGQAVLNLVPPPGQTAVQGFYAGQMLSLQDAAPESVTVLSVSGNSVTLTANLAQNHPADTMVIEPIYQDLGFDDVQQATLLLTENLLKTKGIGPLVLKNDAVQASRQAPEQDLVLEATQLLEPFTAFA